MSITKQSRFFFQSFCVEFDKSSAALQEELLWCCVVRIRDQLRPIPKIFSYIESVFDYIRNFFLQMTL